MSSHRNLVVNNRGVSCYVAYCFERVQSPLTIDTPHPCVVYDVGIHIIAACVAITCKLNYLVIECSYRQ